MDDDRLERWVASGLISAEQARAIRGFEAGEDSATGAAKGRVPLATEALGYLGVALALAAMAVALSQTWSDLALLTRIAIPVAWFVALFAAGSWLRDSPEPAYARFAGALWFMSVAALGWTLGVLMVDVVEADANVVLVIGAGVLAYSAVLYAWRRKTPLHVAMLVGTLMFVGDLAQRFETTEESATWVGLSFLAVGAVWMALARLDILTPGSLGLGLGAATALEGCWLMAQSPGGTAHLGLLTGVALAAALVAGSVWLRENAMLVLGSIGLFGFLLGSVAHFFGETLGTPLVLLAAGLILLAVALLTMKLRQAGHQPPSSDPLELGSQVT